MIRRDCIGGQEDLEGGRGYCGSFIWEAEYVSVSHFCVPVLILLYEHVGFLSVNVEVFISSFTGVTVSAREQVIKPSLFFCIALYLCHSPS